MQRDLTQGHHNIHYYILICGSYSRAATIQSAAFIRKNTVLCEKKGIFALNIFVYNTSTNVRIFLQLLVLLIRKCAINFNINGYIQFFNSNIFDVLYEFGEIC